MTIVVQIGIGLVSAVAMEPVSATIHRVIGHGVAWPIHRSHHEGPVRGPEANDIIPAVSALVTIAMFSIGVFNARFALMVPIAAGVTLYGAAYFAVHDLYIHRRLRLFPAYVRWLEPFKSAHLEHHRSGEGNWGIFRVPGLRLRKQLMAPLAPRRTRMRR